MKLATKRVESLSDCVISIIITIMVFDIKIHKMAEHFTRNDVWKSLAVLGPELIAYFFSFLMIGILWVNHHHLFHLMEKADEKLLWYNLNLLFWMSLIPFPTAMLGGNPFLPESSALYGTILLLNFISFGLLRRYVARHKLMFGEDTTQFQRKIDKVKKQVKLKNIISILAYLISIPMAYLSVYISFVCFAIPAIIFFIPDGVDDEQLEEEIIEKS